MNTRTKWTRKRPRLPMAPVIHPSGKSSGLPPNFHLPSPCSRPTFCVSCVRSWPPLPTCRTSVCAPLQKSRDGSFGGPYKVFLQTRSVGFENVPSGEARGPIPWNRGPIRRDTVSLNRTSHFSSRKQAKIEQFLSTFTWCLVHPSL